MRVEFCDHRDHDGSGGGCPLEWLDGRYYLDPVTRTVLAHIDVSAGELVAAVVRDFPVYRAAEITAAVAEARWEGMLADTLGDMEATVAVLPLPAEPVPAPAVRVRSRWWDRIGRGLLVAAGLAVTATVMLSGPSPTVVDGGTAQRIPVLTTGPGVAAGWLTALAHPSTRPAPPPHRPGATRPAARRTPAPATPSASPAPSTPTAPATSPPPAAGRAGPAPATPPATPSPTVAPSTTPVPPPPPVAPSPTPTPTPTCVPNPAGKGCKD